MTQATTPDTRCDCKTTRGSRCQRRGEFYIGQTVGQQLLCKPHFQEMTRGNEPRFARAARVSRGSDWVSA